MPPIHRGKISKFNKRLNAYKYLRRVKATKRKTKLHWAKLLTNYTKTVAELSRNKAKITYLESMMA